MEFEKFNGTNDKGRLASRFDGVKSVNVSQASHAMAHAEPKIEFESFDEEERWLVSQLRKVDEHLMGYSKAALSRAQAQTRRQHSDDPDKSFAAWMKLRGKMHHERSELVAEKNRIIDRLSHVKPKARNERIQSASPLKREVVDRETGQLNWAPLALDILIELREIRKLLADSIPSAPESTEVSDLDKTSEPD